ncbi:MAG: YggS family pyridoxal phosphate-dependent enzyme [Oscillospiraceae bacterium]|nr:YggS family pyridoxal phosphate-dependent enzyme [Oscillospiraceae bacterium]
MSIAENVAAVRANMAAAARAAGRDPAEIRLVAATKMNDAERVREAIAAGVDICGENRVQEMLEKQRQGAYEGAPLHFIGHLQKNKVKQVVGLAALIHGADSRELLEVISRTAAARGLVQDVLLEVNVGGEASKSGFREEEIPAVLEFASALPALRVRGLMAIPPICDFPEENRPFFCRMQKLFVDNGEKKYDNVSMDFLSMGMSGDYTEAIACGANLVRVGTAIFGARNYQKPNFL